MTAVEYCELWLAGWPQAVVKRCCPLSMRGRVSQKDCIVSVSLFLHLDPHEASNAEDRTRKNGTKTHKHTPTENDKEKALRLFLFLCLNNKASSYSQQLRGTDIKLREDKGGWGKSRGQELPRTAGSQSQQTGLTRRRSTVHGRRRKGSHDQSWDPHSRQQLVQLLHTAAPIHRLAPLNQIYRIGCGRGGSAVMFFSRNVIVDRATASHAIQGGSRAVISRGHGMTGRSGLR